MDKTEYCTDIVVKKFHVVIMSLLKKTKTPPVKLASIRPEPSSSLDRIRVIAKSIGLNLSDEVLTFLAPQVDYRLKELIQAASKFMLAAKRDYLAGSDIDDALKLLKAEPIYGFSSNDPLRFKKAMGHGSLYYVEDKDIEVKKIAKQALPKSTAETAVTSHWLAVDGIQPAIPENVAPTEGLATKNLSKRKNPTEEKNLPGHRETLVQIRPSVKHVLSRQLRCYFERISELVLSPCGPPDREALLEVSLTSLATDPGLHPLLPYFSNMLQEEVNRSLEDTSLLLRLLRVLNSLLNNPHLKLDTYLPQLNPAVMTCLLAKGLGGKPDNTSHWQLRDYAAKLVAMICKKHGPAFSDLQPRLTKTLLVTLLNPERALCQHYGAIRGLAAFGSPTVKLLVVPNLESYWELLRPILSSKESNSVKSENSPQVVKKQDAWRVWGALQEVTGRSMMTLMRKSKIPSGSLNDEMRLHKAKEALKTARKEVEDGVSLQKLAKVISQEKGNVRNTFSVEEDRGTGIQADKTEKPKKRKRAGEEEAGEKDNSEEGDNRKTVDEGGKAEKGDVEQQVGKKSEGPVKEGKGWEKMLGVFGDGALTYVPLKKMNNTLF